MRFNQILGIALVPDDMLHFSDGTHLWRVDRNGRIQALARADIGAAVDSECFAGRSERALPPMVVGPFAFAPDSSVLGTGSCSR